MENEQIVKTQNVREDVTGDAKASLFLSNFDDIQKLCISLKNSTAAKVFWQSITVKDKDGKDLRDENDNLVTEKVFNESDMAMCIGIGLQLGLNPMTSLSFGKLLDIDAIQKIEIGKSIGLTPINALNSVYIFNAGGRKVTYVAYNIISGLLTKNGVSIKIIKDGRIGRTQYRDFITNEIVYTLTDKHSDISILKGTPDINNVAVQLVEGGKKPVYNVQINYEVEIVFERYNKQLNKVVENTVYYDSQQAIDAGLLAGIKSDNTPSKGKDNWNNYCASNLRKMAVMEASRVLFADITNGLYIAEEFNNLDK